LEKHGITKVCINSVAQGVAQSVAQAVALKNVRTKRNIHYSVAYVQKVRKRKLQQCGS
jgi:hypothetical protein